MATMQTMQNQVLRSLIAELLEQGFSLTVDDGEDYPVVKSTDADEVFDALQSVDEEHLRVYKNDNLYAIVFLVYGNDGYDVIADCHTKLSAHMVKTSALIDELAG